MCTKFAKFMLGLMNWESIFTTNLVFIVSDFKHCCRISNTRRIIKMQITIFTKICHGCIIRLTHIFAACNSSKNTMLYPKQFQSWRIHCSVWTALLRKFITKCVKDFPKRLEDSVSAYWAILNIKYDQWHNRYWWRTLLPYDFINVMSMFQKKFVNTAENCNWTLKFRCYCCKNCYSFHK